MTITEILEKRGWKRDGNAFFKKNGQIDRCDPPGEYAETIYMDEHGRFTMDEDALELMLREDEPMTVREAFEAAYAPIPEGATCHFAWVNSVSGDVEWGQAVVEYRTPSNPHRSREILAWNSADERWESLFDVCEDPLPWGDDLSKFPAPCYAYFADKRYDEVVSK